MNSMDDSHHRVCVCMCVGVSVHVGVGVGTKLPHWCMHVYLVSPYVGNW